MNQPATSICSRFDRQAAHYEQLADLQRAVAWRLAHWVARLPLPCGPCADLGAGSGLVGQALAQQRPGTPLLQLDGSPALLSRNDLARPGLLWDLELGLPPSLQHCALLTSSFALQWLRDPTRTLELWAQALAPGGWLALAVPVAGSFPQWHEAAARAGIPCTAQPLPSAQELIASADALLQLQLAQDLCFSRPYGSGGASTARQFLRRVRRLGAGSSSRASLSTGQWRQLLAHWPTSPLVSWRVLLLIGQRPLATTP